MSDLSNKRVLFYDYGLFIETAVVASRHFGEVLYYCPWKSAYPASNKALIGDGLDEIKRVRDFFDWVDKSDLIVFPDLGDGDLQIYLRDKGRNVWGGGKSEELENFRWQTKQLMKKLGLPIQPVERITGLQKLRDRLKNESEVKWIKVSTFRGDWETKKFDGDYRMFEPMLDEMEHKMGEKKKVMEFIVEDDIPDAVESGYDGWNIDGMWPDVAMLGFEVKGLGLIGKVYPYADFPKPVKRVNAALSPYFKEKGCRGFFSSEIRDGVLIDPCCRTPSPPGELYPEMYSNIGEILYYGAQGELVQPKPIWEFGVEVTIESDWAEKNWQNIYFPDSIRQFVKLRNFAKFGDQYCVLPQQEGPRVGAVIGLGHTLKEAVQKTLDYAAMIKGYHIECNTDAIDKGLIEIEKAQAELGVDFTNEPVPDQNEIAEMADKA